MCLMREFRNSTLLSHNVNPTQFENTVTSTTMTTTTTTTTTAKPKLCDAGFVKFEDNCYLLELDETNWSSARTRCRILDADLVSVNTEAENDFLIEKIKEYYPPDKKKSAYFWMGMMYASGNFMWVDGTDVGFTDWRSTWGHNCMDGKCKAYITASRSVYKWEGAGRNNDFHYICEKNAS